MMGSIWGINMQNNYFFFSICVLVVAFVSSPTFAEETDIGFLANGEFFGQARYRYEYVDQSGFPEDAEASTIRLNLGYKTGKYEEFQALIEGQIVQHVGPENFNDTVNGRTSFPTISDPDNQEINQAWISWTGLSDTTLKVGRQAFNFDNLRFIGTVDWRQNDQTFDAEYISYNGIEKTQLQYGHIWNVNRILGNDHPLGDLSSESHFLRATHKQSEALNFLLYGYWFDFDRAPALSSQTYGARLTGDFPITDNWTLSYQLETAKQNDYANNAANYDEPYYHISPAISDKKWTFAVGYELLGGNGTSSFQTPLATLHAQNGWADKFLSTPGGGLKDIYGKVAYKIMDPETTWLNNTTLTAVYHDFSGDTGGDYGSELNISASKAFSLPHEYKTGPLEVLLKYARFNADNAPYTDTEKAWLQISIGF